MILKINPNHPCKTCIVRPMCNLDCQELHTYMTDTYVQISEYIEREHPNKNFNERIDLRSYLLNQHIEQWRAKPILK